MENINLRPSALIQPPKVLTIGSSTGGLKALKTLFEGLKNYAIKMPILITQHVPDKFDESFVRKIHESSGIPCKVAQDDDIVEDGKIYFAPSGVHMSVKRNMRDEVYIKLIDGEKVNYCKPAVDPMLFSVAEVYGKNTFTVILTGIGSDGLHGSNKIVEVGGTVIAQDVSTSIVWGMPGAVAKAGICSAVLPIEEIASYLKKNSYGKII